MEMEGIQTASRMAELELEERTGYEAGLETYEQGRMIL